MSEEPARCPDCRGIVPAADLDEHRRVQHEKCPECGGFDGSHEGRLPSQHAETCARGKVPPPPSKVPRAPARASRSR